MPSIALQLTPELVTAACQVVGSEPNPDMFGDCTYAIITPVSSTEFNFKLATDDEIFAAAKNDSELHIISV